MSRNYKFHDSHGTYFVSFATVQWVDIFVRDEYMRLFLDSVQRQEKNGLQLNAYCIMTNHVHLVFSATKGNPGILINQIKSQFSKKFISLLLNNKSEYRKNRLLDMFINEAKATSASKHYKLWQHNNKPIELWSNHVIDQKINYIHNNPVKAGMVARPEHWKYSSARTYLGEEGMIDIVVL